MADISLHKISIDSNYQELVIQKGFITLTNTNASSLAQSSGSLITNGGITILNTVNSSNFTSGGAMSVAGGISVLKDTYCGQNVNINENLNVFGFSQSRFKIDNSSMQSAPNGIDTRLNLSNNTLILSFENSTSESLIVNGGSVTIHNTNIAINSTIGGAMTLFGGMSVAKNTFIGDTLDIGNNLDVNNIITIGTRGQLLMNNQYIYNISNGNNQVYINNNLVQDTSQTSSNFLNTAIFNAPVISNVAFVVNSTQNAINLSTGSIVNYGGMSIARDVLIGGSIGINNTSDHVNKIILEQTSNSLSENSFFTGIGSSNGSILINSLRDFIITSPGNMVKLNVKNNGDFLFANNYSLICNNTRGVTLVNTLGNDTIFNIKNSIGNNLVNIYNNNNEFMNIGWNNKFVIATGSVNSLSLNSSSIENQLFLSTSGSVIIGSTRESIDADMAAFIVNGGISVKSTSNVTSISGGGCMTLGGGLSVAKDLFIGSLLKLNANSDHSIELTSSTSGGYTQFIVNSTLYPEFKLQNTGMTSSYPFLVELSCNNTTTESLVIGGDNMRYSIKSIGIVKDLLLNTGLTNMILSTNGNIGINTTNPSFTLDVNGVINTIDVRSNTVSTNAITVNGLASAINSSTGSISVMGGIAVNKNAIIRDTLAVLNTGSSLNSSSGSVVFNGGLSINCTENSSSYTNGGAVSIAGGVSIGKDLFVNGNINTTGYISNIYLVATSSDNSINSSTGSIISFGGLSLNCPSNSTSITSGGGITCNGGASIKRDMYIGGNTFNYGTNNLFSPNDNVFVFYDNLNVKRFSIDLNVSNKNFSISHYNNSGAFIEKSIDISGNTGTVSFNNTTVSSNTNAGIITESGITILNTTNAIDLQNGGGMTILGGLSVYRDIYSNGIVSLLSTVNSTNSTNGSLIVKGGIGVAGDINVQGNVSIIGSLFVRGTVSSINSTTINILDNILVLNAGANGSRDSGFIINRYQTENDTGLGDVVFDTDPVNFTLPSQISLTSSEIKLPSIANSNNGYYVGWWMKINSGFSNDQVRKVTGYNGTTKIATLMSPFTNQNPSIGDTVLLFFKPYVGLIYNEINDYFELGSTVSNPGNNPTQFTGYADLHVNNLNISSTKVSINSSIGSLVVLGGVAINCSENSVSSTQGGCLTVNGGCAVHRKLYVGENIYINGKDISPNTFDIVVPVTFNAMSNITQNISSLLFDNTVSGVDIYLSVAMLSSVNQYAYYNIRLINKNGMWDITTTYTGDLIHLDFNISNSGQLSYTSQNYTGFSSMTFKYRCITV
jgi:uncharacterized protein (AIM24 family)